MFSLSVQNSIALILGLWVVVYIIALITVFKINKKYLNLTVFFFNIIVLFIVIKLNQKYRKHENFKSKYPFKAGSIYPGHLNMLPELKKGVRPGNSPHRSRD